MKLINRFGKAAMSLFLTFCLMCPLCPSVMGAVSAEPAFQTLLYADDFSDGVIAPNIATYRFYTQSPADTLTETGGKLVFERQKWIWNTDKEYGEPSVIIYATEDHSPVSGEIYTKFTLSKTREVVPVSYTHLRAHET